MKNRKLKHSRLLMTVLQGFLLLAILSTLFSACVNVMVTGFTDDINTLSENIAAEQARMREDNRQKTAEALEKLNQATEMLEKYREAAGSLTPLAIIMYASFALLFLVKAFDSRGVWRLNLFRYGIGSLLFAACTLLFVFCDPIKASGPAATLHAAALTVDHVFSIVRSRKVRNVVPRVLSILLLLFVAVCPFVMGGSTALLYILLLTVPRVFYYIARIAFSRIKLDVLRKIVRKTYAAEILFGMLMLIIAFSIVLPQFEEGIPRFEDAIWYCFAIATTIGLGDFTAVTLPGRAISAILGLYGIIVVALVTSIIVNFYNETKNSGDPDDEEETEAADPRQDGAGQLPPPEK